MPRPPSVWSDEQIDAHWEGDHRCIAEELCALQVQKTAHLRLASLAQRAIDLFGAVTLYDMEVFAGSLDTMIILHDATALTDGVWLAGRGNIPAGLRAGILPARGKEAQRQRGKAWAYLIPRLLRTPWTTQGLPHTNQGQPKMHHGVSIRFQILARDHYRCRICGTAAADGPDVRLEVDHITPRSKGGTDDIMNLWVLCFRCNRGKGAHDL